jgi:hypothetical protein
MHLLFIVTIISNGLCLYLFAIKDKRFVLTYLLFMLLLIIVCLMLIYYWCVCIIRVVVGLLHFIYIIHVYIVFIVIVYVRCYSFLLFVLTMPYYFLSKANSSQYIYDGCVIQWISLMSLNADLLIECILTYFKCILWFSC